MTCKPLMYSCKKVVIGHKGKFIIYVNRHQILNVLLTSLDRQRQVRFSHKQTYKH